MTSKSSTRTTRSLSRAAGIGRIVVALRILIRLVGRDLLGDLLSDARIELDKALGRVMFSIMSDEAQLYKQWSDNESFKKWLADAVFNTTYGKSA